MRATALALLWLAVGAAPLAGCTERETAGTGYDLRWTLTPTPPVVGDARLEFRVLDAAGTPVPVTTPRVEGHMSHPGMAPVVAAAAEVAPLRYESRFAFTMRGDWTLLVLATLPDGRRFQRRIDVAGVRPPA
jgi:hypothetical protein